MGISKINLDSVRWYDDGKHSKMFVLYEKLIHQKVQSILDSGFQLLKDDIVSFHYLEEDGQEEGMNFRLINRQIYFLEDKVNVIYYFDNL